MREKLDELQMKQAEKLEGELERPRLTGWEVS